MRQLIGLVAVMLMAIVSIAGATSDFSFTEHIMRPDAVTGAAYFDFTDTVAVSGWNQWGHTSSSTLGTFDSMSMFQFQDVPQGAAPLEDSFEQTTLSSEKGGNPADPWMLQQLTTSATVGSVGPNDGDPNNRYDTLTYNMEGMFNSNGDRGLSTLLTSSQDDFVKYFSANNAGYDFPIASSTMTIEKPWDSQAYSELNIADNTMWSLNKFDWDNSITVMFQNYPIAFNIGK